MESETGGVCNIENRIKDFQKKHEECNFCKSKRGCKRYYDEKIRTSNKRKIYYGIKAKNYSKQNDRYKQTKDLVISHEKKVSRLKAME